MWKPFLGGIVVAGIALGLAAAAWNSFSGAANAGKEKKYASDLLVIADALASYKTSNGNYPAVCDWQSLRASLPNTFKSHSGFDNGLFYCSNGFSYVLLYRPFGATTPLRGLNSAYGMSNGRWISWPEELPIESRRDAE